MIKSAYKLEIEGNSTNLIKALYENPQLASCSWYMAENLYPQIRTRMRLPAVTTS